MKASRANIRQMKTLEQVVEHLANMQEQLDEIKEALVALSGKGSSSALDAISAEVLDKVNEALPAAAPEKPVTKVKQHGTGG